MEHYIHIIAALFGLMAGICLATIWAVKKTLDATAKMVLSQMRDNEATVDEMKRFILLDLIYQFEDREDYKNAAHAKKILDELEKKEYA